MRALSGPRSVECLLSRAVHPAQIRRAGLCPAPDNTSGRVDNSEGGTTEARPHSGMFHQPQCGTIQPIPIDHVLAVVPVSDIQVAQQWYEALVGRPEDNHPMDTLDEWRITNNGWVQVFHDPERAGSTLLNFAVDDLES